MRVYLLFVGVANYLCDQTEARPLELAENYRFRYISTTFFFFILNLLIPAP